jgi:hypothetical protein
VNTWTARVSEEEMRKRACGRRRYNAVRSLLKTLRREEVLALLEAWGFHYGVQKRVAEALNVDPSVISRDIAALAPLVESCPACGSCVPRPRG